MNFGLFMTQQVSNAITNPLCNGVATWNYGDGPYEDYYGDYYDGDDEDEDEDDDGVYYDPDQYGVVAPLRHVYHD